MIKCPLQTFPRITNMYKNLQKKNTSVQNALTPEWGGGGRDYKVYETPCSKIYMTDPLVHTNEKNSIKNSPPSKNGYLYKNNRNKDHK